MPCPCPPRCRGVLQAVWMDRRRLRHGQDHARFPPTVQLFLLQVYLSPHQERFKHTNTHAREVKSWGH
eukprot:2787857-Rhodomonas_salina.1